jgi:hypothetical protein
MLADVVLEHAEEYVLAKVLRDGAKIVFAVLGFGSRADYDARKAAIRWARENGYIIAHEISDAA